MESEVLIGLPGTFRPVIGVRSTLIQASLDALRRRAYFDRYVTLLDPTFRAAILETLAPEWLPVAVAEAHYSACEALDVNPKEVQGIGEEVGERMQGTFIGTLVRKARTVGLTPWVPLSQFARLWERLMQGGAVGLTKTGPKDVEVDIRLLSLARFAYFRWSFTGVVSAGIKLGAGKAVTVRVAAGKYDQRLIFKCSWV